MRTVRTPSELLGISRWVLVVLAVLLALASVMLVAPFAVRPVDVPLPVVDLRTLAARVGADHAHGEAFGAFLASELTSGHADAHFDLRALGEAVRAFGRAEATDDNVGLVKARKSVLEAVARARAGGDETLVAFRAFQTLLFLQEVRRWERSSLASTDLLELGGSFVEMATRYGWVERDHRLKLDETTRSVFFRLRWNEITGLGAPAFLMSLDEQRLLYRFLLSADARPTDRSVTPADAGAERRKDALWRLRKIDELSRVDPTYPAALARGVVLYQMGEAAAAAQAFREHLSQSADGPYALLARNYLLAAVARAADESW